MSDEHKYRIILSSTKNLTDQEFEEAVKIMLYDFDGVLIRRERGIERLDKFTLVEAVNLEGLKSEGVKNEG